MLLRTLFIGLVVTPAAAQPKVPSPAEQIATAVLPLPEVLRAGAGVRGYDERLTKITLRASTNGMTCTGDKPGDQIFDVRCYENAFLKVIDRRRELVDSDIMGSRDDRFEAEIKTGKVRLPSQPTAGYRMLGPIGAFDPRTLTFTEAIERWQSVHFPYKTAAEVGLPVDREGTMPYVMASGTWWSHVMFQHTLPLATPIEESGRLGTIAFPTSGRPEAQADFERGVLYLHSFEYDSAAKAFRAAQEKDAGFTMAYWGEAMTSTHPIWNEQNVEAARAVLARLGPSREARAARAPTAREKAWLNAIEVLYGNEPKARRDTLFAEQMAGIVASHPDDEAKTFLALALMGLNQGVRDVPAYMRAGALALEVLGRNPDHPGAAHYVIHAFDDPTHATLGLQAARAYSRIAPGAAHAQHMTTHIFLALGMWPDVISQNTAAAGPDRARWRAGHYTYWLHYGLLQSGRFDEAVALLDRLKAQSTDPRAGYTAAHLAWTRAQQVINTERWGDPSLGWRLDVPAGSRTAQAVDGFARGFAALNHGNLAVAETLASNLATMPSGQGLDSLPALLAGQLSAALTRARGNKPGAEAQLRAVAARSLTLPAEFGPPDFVKPPFELLGEWFLADGRFADAKQAFGQALALMPGRWLSLRGLDQATQRLAVRGDNPNE